MTKQQNQNEQQSNPAPGPAPEARQMSIADLKQAVCKKLQQIFSSELMQERLLKMAGGDQSRVAKNLTSYLSMLTQDEGAPRDNKKYYVQCSMTSLTTCFLESMNMQLPFDSRNLVSLIIYANDAGGLDAELDISYKGFVNALNKHYDNAYVDAKLVFEEDLFECEESGGNAIFKHIAQKPFRTITKDFTSIAGGYCYFSYTTKSGAPISRIIRMSRDDIIKIKSKAKTKYVWEDFPSEMGIKALIRRGAKIPFAAIDLDMDIEEVANKHYMLDKPPVAQRLENLIKAQEGIVDGENKKPEGESEHAEPDQAGAEKPDKDAQSGKADQAAANRADRVSADAITSGIHGELPDDQEQRKPEISDADFEEVKNEPGPTEKTSETAPQVNTDRSDKTPSGPSDWDGKTIYTGDGKLTAKDWVSAMQAMIYLKKVISQRKHKASRLEIINGNGPLLAALIKDKQGATVAELHKLAGQGE